MQRNSVMVSLVVSAWKRNIRSTWIRSVLNYPMLSNSICIQLEGKYGRLQNGIGPFEYEERRLSYDYKPVPKWKC